MFDNQLEWVDNLSLLLLAIHSPPTLLIGYLVHSPLELQDYPNSCGIYLISLID
jgi:hypothetical protein